MSSIHPLWLILLSLGIAVIPIVVGIATSFVKVSIVLGLLRSGLGAPQVPSGIVITALSLAITSYVMGPTVEQTLAVAEQMSMPDLASAPQGELRSTFEPLLSPWRDFLTTHSASRELEVFARMEGHDPQEAPALRTLLLGFLLTELREAFTMGLALLLPFLVLDLVIANVLVGLGMFMVSPVLIALPLKLLLFVMADGWLLLTRGLVLSYGVGG